MLDRIDFMEMKHTFNTNEHMYFNGTLILYKYVYNFYVDFTIEIEHTVQFVHMPVCMSTDIVISRCCHCAQNRSCDSSLHSYSNSL